MKDRLIGIEYSLEMSYINQPLSRMRQNSKNEEIYKQKAIS